MPATNRPRDAGRLAPAHPSTLLMVDDDADLLDALADLVEHNLPGVKVLRATSGREGLGLLQGNHVDGIVSDLAMDGMDGLQFLHIAKQCHPDVPRLMLTAHADPVLGRKAQAEADVQSFMSKLIEPQDLLHRISDLLTHHPETASAA